MVYCNYCDVYLIEKHFSILYFNVLFTLSSDHNNYWAVRIKSAEWAIYKYLPAHLLLRLSSEENVLAIDNLYKRCFRA